MNPKDRKGNALEIGDKVWLCNAYDGLRLFQANVIGFEPEPDYDKSTIGIFVDTQTGSVHPNCIEKVAASQ